MLNLCCIFNLDLLWIIYIFSSKLATFMSFEAESWLQQSHSVSKKISSPVNSYQKPHWPIESKDEAALPFHKWLIFCFFYFISQITYPTNSVKCFFLHSYLLLQVIYSPPSLAKASALVTKGCFYLSIFWNSSRLAGIFTVNLKKIVIFSTFGIIAKMSESADFLWYSISLRCN